MKAAKYLHNLFLQTLERAKAQGTKTLSSLPPIQDQRIPSNMIPVKIGLGKFGGIVDGLKRNSGKIHLSDHFPASYNRRLWKRGIVAGHGKVNCTLPILGTKECHLAFVGFDRGRNLRIHTEDHPSS
jgi:hypothetical protein